MTKEIASFQDWHHDPKLSAGDFVMIFILAVWSAGLRQFLRLPGGNYYGKLVEEVVVSDCTRERRISYNVGFGMALSLSLFWTTSISITTMLIQSTQLSYSGLERYFVEIRY
jgi:hypothetical protein